ncbi:phosphatase 2C [Thraustotheca clavata]|uniref:Phosphatase 2C n=1 Tax=Thraustotheca clavata TaxID=74557 RepID=A0A1V9ZFF6_9STRA|nr:phosphatase 2C [Thraustotheca clavata]
MGTCMTTASKKTASFAASITEKPLERLHRRREGPAMKALHRHCHTLDESEDINSTIQHSIDGTPSTLLSPKDPSLLHAVYLAYEPMLDIITSPPATKSAIVPDFGGVAFQNNQIKMRMEDKAAFVLSMHGPQGIPYDFFGVYDGHGGDFVSNYLATHLHEDIQQLFQQDATMSVENAIITSFIAVDSALEDLEEADVCGSTAVVALLSQFDGYVANIGDSHCFLFDGCHFYRLSDDHHVRNSMEISRIKENQGIIFNQRVSGVSKVTRAFGQNNEKEFIIATPHITKFKRPVEGGFLVLVSDGVTDVFSDQDIEKYVRRGLHTYQMDAQTVSSKLLEACRLRRAHDNMTAAIVLL